MSVLGIGSFEATSIVVGLCDIQQLAVDSELCGDHFWDILEKAFYIDLAHVFLCQSFIDLGEISAVDEYAD